jgi:hypothetical protein
VVSRIGVGGCAVLLRQKEAAWSATSSAGGVRRQYDIAHRLRRTATTPSNGDFNDYCYCIGWFFESHHDLFTGCGDSERSSDISGTSQQPESFGSRIYIGGCAVFF